MASPFAHLEVLGPRASLDEWLGSIQDHGGCHLADALEDLGGEAGIGRPGPSAAERAAWTLRSEAAHTLRALDRFLPPTPKDEDASLRPSWSVGREGEGERDLTALLDEARTLGRRLAEALEDARAAAHAVADVEDLRLVVGALEAAGQVEVSGRAWRVPHHEGARPGRLVRALRRRGLRPVTAEGRRGTVVVAPEAVSGMDLTAEAAGACAEEIHIDEGVVNLGLASATQTVGSRAEPAHARHETTQTALRRRLDEDGGRARLLVDALVDAEARAEAWERLAATKHVAAARLFVRREDASAFVHQLSVKFGREVVARELAPAGREPSLPHAVAGLPFAAMDGLRPSRFGEVSTASVLAVLVPVLFGAVLADLAGGVLLLLAGAFIGAGAAVGSPRRDTALLAQLGGLAALVLGILEGRAFGSAGALFFGEGWGLDPGGRLLPVLDVGRGFVVRLGGAAFLLAIWGASAALRGVRDGRPAAARTAGLGTLVLLAVAGGSALALPAGHVLRHAWWLAPAAVLGAFVLGGARRGLGRLLLDGVGVFRLVAVAVLALLAFDIAFSVLAEPSLTRLVAAPALLLFATLAVIVDPAYVAMGVPYDLSLGSRGLSRPFTPFARRVVRAPGAADDVLQPERRVP